MPPEDPQGTQGDPTAILDQLEAELNAINQGVGDIMDSIDQDVNGQVQDASGSIDSILEDLDQNIDAQFQSMDPGAFLEWIQGDLSVDFINPNPFLDYVENDQNSAGTEGILDNLGGLLDILRAFLKFISFDWLDDENRPNWASKLAEFVMEIMEAQYRKAHESLGEGGGGSSTPGGSGGGGGGYAWPESWQVGKP